MASTSKEVVSSCAKMSEATSDDAASIRYHDLHAELVCTVPFVELLRFYMVKAEVTQAQVASALGISKSAVSQWLSLKPSRKLPSGKQIYLLGGILNLNLRQHRYLTELFGFQGQLDYWAKRIRTTSVYNQAFQDEIEAAIPRLDEILEVCQSVIDDELSVV